MQKRSFIAIFILFSYTIGFSHYLIPHCDTGHEESIIHDSEEHAIHFHQHHDENLVENKEDHAHYKHEDHFDEGFYDLLVCFLSKVEHPETEGCLDPVIIKTLDKTTSTSKKDQAQLAILFGLVSNVIIFSNEEDVYLHSIEFYHSPPIHSPPNRGPPVISC